MKKAGIIFFVLAGLLFLLPSEACSQKGKIAPFKIVLADGKTFSAQDLPKGKPVVLIYFSPECEECQKLTETLIKNIDDYWGISFTMVTYLPVESVSQFVVKFNLKKYPNFYVGTEGNSFIVRYYYNVKKFPFVAVYDRNGNLVKIYNTEAEVKELPSKLKNL